MYTYASPLDLSFIWFIMNKETWVVSFWVNVWYNSENLPLRFILGTHQQVQLLKGQVVLFESKLWK